MNIFMRSPRRWINFLAEKIGCETRYENKEMFEKASGFRRRIISLILSLYKKSFLPPIEWYVNYDKLYKIKNNVDIIIEPGTKIINTKHNYIVYVENAIGLFGFNTKKINVFNVFLFKRKIAKNNFKGFVFYSETARKSTFNLFSKLGIESYFSKYDLGIIYPITKDVDNIGNSNSDSQIKLMFCSSSFNLKGGREFVEAIQKSKYKEKIKAVIVTKVNSRIKNLMNELDSYELHDFNLSEYEYMQLCLNSDLVVHPTFFDTHALSLLEAVKAVKPVIATSTFAIPEYIKNNITGIIINNPYSPYNEKGEPNFIGTALGYAEKIDKLPLNNSFSIEIASAIDYIIENYEQFENNCKNEQYINCQFSENVIVTQWNHMLKKVVSQ